MAVMESTLYLPEEELNFRNYPEVRPILSDIQELINYATKASNALKMYTNSTLDKVDLSIVDLLKYTKLCRSVCSTLGMAPNPCYDLLVELRVLQRILQTLVFVKNRYGSQYIGVPSNPSTVATSNTI